MVAIAVLIGFTLGVIVMGLLSFTGETGHAPPGPDPDLERQIGEALHPSRVGAE